MRKYKFLIFPLIYLFPLIVLPQGVEQQTSNFSSRIRNPVKIEVTAGGKEITFAAENTSYYPD